jgi:hypothetical protein
MGTTLAGRDILSLGSRNPDNVHLKVLERTKYIAQMQLKITSEKKTLGQS